MIPKSDDDHNDRLVALVLGGDRSALEELLIRNYDWLESYIIRLMPANQQGLLSSEDIIQEVYLRVFRNIDALELQGRGQLFSWLKTIARNTTFDALRKHQRTRGQLPNQPAAKSTTDSGELRNLIDDLAVDQETQASGIVRAKELRQAFWVALGTLPEEYRQVIQMLYIEERSIESVAEELNKSVDSVRGIRMRARKHLRKSVGKLSLYI